jgi:hypothetical protein
MLGVLCPLVDVYVGLSMLTVAAALCFLFFLVCVLKFPSEIVSIQFVSRDISSVIWVIEFY